jgi:four helix bundle protein
MSGGDLTEKNTFKIRDHRDLLVWRKGMDLAVAAYDLTARFPKDERFGRVSQMRGAAVSVPSNIPEGHARRTTGEFLQFISQAEGSLAELDRQLRLSAVLKFCSALDAEALLSSITECRKMLTGPRHKLAIP